MTPPGATPANTLAVIVGALNDAEIPHMLAGSFASSLHGLARTTADIDLVIDPGADAIDRFVGQLDRERHYVDEATAHEAVSSRSQFNVIDTSTGWKVDLIVVKDRPFSAVEFARRIPVTVLGVSLFTATAEDTVLAKLEWSKLGGSERQMRDASEVLRLRRSDIDDEYLDHWALELDIGDMLASARRASEN